MNYTDWSKQTLDYDFNHIFILVSVIYVLSTMFDFCLTFIVFRLSPDNFFKYEISFIIKNVLSGDPLFCMLIVFIVIGPLIVVYGINAYHLKHHGMSVNEIKICFYSLYSISLLHIIGGWTNFLLLINLRM